MRHSKSITNISTKYPMGMHVDLQQQIYTMIQPFEAKKLLLTDSDIPAWKADIDKEQEVVSEAMAAEETAYLIEKVKKRNKVVTSIFQEIRLASKSLIEERRGAGHRLHLIINPYKGLQRENIFEETGHIAGLLYDLDKTSARADLTTIGLAPVVTMLHTINNEFMTLRDSRMKAKALSRLPNGNALRTKNDDTANEIFRHIEAAYLAAATEEEAAPIGELIDRLNRVLASIRTAYRQRIAQKRSAAEKKSQGKQGDQADDLAEQVTSADSFGSSDGEQTNDAQSGGIIEE